MSCKPFLKYVGSKQQLLPQLEALLPPGQFAYHEPFVGGGSLFFHIHERVTHAVLNDANERLVRTYRGVRDDVEVLIEKLQRCVNTEEFFLHHRARGGESAFDRSSGDTTIAAWLIYLNKTAFNGLYRVNKSGGFNVPFGHYANPTICDEARLRACSAALQDKTALFSGDFEDSILEAGLDVDPGSVWYADPPYIPISTSSAFTSYTVGGFGMSEQIRLRDLALRLKQKGVRVILSNSSAPAVRELYARGFDIQEVEVRRCVSATVGGRGAMKEVIIT